MATTPSHVLVPRAEARDLYLRIFDDFSLEVPSPPDDVRLQITVDAINERFKNYVDHQNERHPSIVLSNVNGEYDVWQCWETYDSIDREEAERLFDEAWTPEHEHAMVRTAKPSRSTTDPARANTDSWKCHCGCGKNRRSKSTLFAAGHDARFASNLIKAVKAGTMTEHDAITQAIEASPALGRSVDDAIARWRNTPGHAPGAAVKAATTKATPKRAPRKAGGDGPEALKRLLTF